jgi:hypothetical protein
LHIEASGTCKEEMVYKWKKSSFNHSLLIFLHSSKASYCGVVGCDWLYDMLEDPENIGVLCLPTFVNVSSSDSAEDHYIIIIRLLYIIFSHHTQDLVECLRLFFHTEGMMYPWGMF